MNYFSGRLSTLLASNVNLEIPRNKTVASHAKWLRALLVVLLCALCAAGTFAQAPTSSIVGTVLDPQGLPIEAATVTLTNVGTSYSYTTTTSSTGAYRFERLDAAVYRVTVDAAGFRQSVVDNIKLDAATDYSVPPVKLEVGQKTETITVEAGAEIVNTTDTEVSSTVEKKQIDDLPILDRNPLALLELEPGVNQNIQFGVSPSSTISGQRSTYSNLTLDGINIQDNFIREGTLDYSPNLPFNSQAQEFTVINQNAGVEYGNGASQVAIVTPKGTNQYHGEGFWYYRTNAWAANNWFNDATGVPLGKLIQNQGGGNFGGPIKKDKLFAYGWYELLRAKQQQPNETTVLSQRIISALSAPTPTLPFTYTPLDANGNPDPGGPVTVNLLTVENSNPLRGTGGVPGPTTFTVDPSMLALIQRVPGASANNNRVGDGVNLLGYQFNQRDNDTLDNYGFRIDYDLNNHNTISGTWAWNRQVTDRPNCSCGGDPSYNVIPAVSNNYSTKFLSVAWRWSPSGTITNEARFGFNIAPAYFYTTQQFGSYILNDSTLPFTDPNPNFLPQGRDTHTWNGLDNASFTKGNHTIKFGGAVYRTTIFTTSTDQYTTYNLGFSNNNPEGLLTSDFPSSNPSVYSIGSTDYTNAGAILASAAGILSSVSQTFNATSTTSGYQAAPLNRNYRENVFSVYAGDSWRVNPKLTVNYGLRWDYFGPVNEKEGLGLLPVIPQGSTIQDTLLSNATVDFAGGNAYRGFYDGYWKAFSPNIGIAWDPFGDGKTAVRAGFSINYVNDEFFTAVNNAVGNNIGLSFTNTNAGLFGPTVANPMGAQNVPVPPFAIPTTLSTNAYNAIGPDFTGYLATSNVAYSIDPHLKPPQVQQWNLSVQRDIGWNTSLQVSYVGNHGVGLFRAIDLNQLNFNASVVCANLPAGVPCPNDTFFQDFQTARANGFASLAAGQGFNPYYNCSPPPGSAPGTPCLPVFNALYGGGLNYPFILNYLYFGQIGDMILTYHEFGFDANGTGYPSANNIINFYKNPYIFGADLLKNTSFSSYNAGIIEVRRRFSKGLYFQANYTFSKTMTDFGGSQTQFQPYQDNARPYLEKARAPFDITQAFKANFTYEIPIGKGHSLLNNGNKALGLLVDGWQTASVFTWQSGPPFSILSQWASFNRTGRDAANTASSTLTHQQISGDLGVFVQNNGVVYAINPKLISANGTGVGLPGTTCTPGVPNGFCNPQPGQVGNLQLNAFNGPVYFDWDLSAWKDFNITEKLKLTFKTDAFNVLNHPVFFVGDQNINSTNFGQSTTTLSTARILQMSLRLKF